MSQPEFSFIIATHNEDPAILDATVQGLRSLGGKEVVEIIVVDDASDVPVSLDDLPTATWLRRSKQRLGIAKARNWGVSEATGRTLIFTDAHVAFSPNILDVLRSSGVAEGDGIRGCETAILYDPAALMNAASRNPGQLVNVVASYLGWRLDLKGFPRVEPISAGTPVDDTWENVPYVGGCCLAISRELFDELGGFAECLVGIGNGGDLELAIRCHAVGLPVRSTRLATCYHLTENRKHSIDYSDPLSAYDLDRYPGSTVNLFRTLFIYFDGTETEDKARRAGMTWEQFAFMAWGDKWAFADRLNSIRGKCVDGARRIIREKMTAGEPL